MGLHIIARHVQRFLEPVDQLDIRNVTDDLVRCFLAPDDLACDEINVLNLAVIYNRCIDGLILAGSLSQLNETFPTIPAGFPSLRSGLSLQPFGCHALGGVTHLLPYAATFITASLYTTANIPNDNFNHLPFSYFVFAIARYCPLNGGFHR